MQTEVVSVLEWYFEMKIANFLQRPRPPFRLLEAAAVFIACSLHTLMARCSVFQCSYDEQVFLLTLKKKKKNSAEPSYHFREKRKNRKLRDTLQFRKNDVTDPKAKKLF